MLHQYVVEQGTALIGLHAIVRGDDRLNVVVDLAEAHSQVARQRVEVGEGQVDEGRAVVQPHRQNDAPEDEADVGDGAGVPAAVAHHAEHHQADEGAHVDDHHGLRHHALCLGEPHVGHGHVQAHGRRRDDALEDGEGRQPVHVVHLLALVVQLRHEGEVDGPDGQRHVDLVGGAGGVGLAQVVAHRWVLDEGQRQVAQADHPHEAVEDEAVHAPGGRFQLAPDIALQVVLDGLREEAIGAQVLVNLRDLVRGQVALREDDLILGGVRIEGRRAKLTHLDAVAGGGSGIGGLVLNVVNNYMGC